MIALLDMPLTRRLTPLILAVVVAAVTFELIRRRKLLEEYAVFWMVTSLILLIVAIFPEIIIWLQEVLQTNYLTIVILMLFTLISLVMLHFAVIASRYAGQIRQLSQRMALLESLVRKVAGDGTGAPLSPAPAPGAEHGPEPGDRGGEQSEAT
jgi:hypothetical protein